MNTNKEKVLITGARGFIGKETIKKLKKNYIIYAISSKDIKNIKNVFYYNYNRKKLSFLKNIKIDYLINCHGKILNDNFKNIYDDHLKFSQKLFKNIDHNYLKKIIHIGSMDEYSNFIKGKDRDLKENPTSNYAKVKQLVSNYTLTFAKKNNIDCIVLRIFLAYGKTQKRPRLIPYLKYCIKNKKIADLNDYTAIKSFIHIDDLIKIINFVIQNKMKHNIYNISNDRKYSIKSIARLLKEKYNLNFTYKIKQKPKSQYLTNSKINKEYKFKYRNFYEELQQIIVSK